MKRSPLKTFNENSLDRFISDEKKMLYIKQSRLKTLMDGWMGGWMDGWVGGWMVGKAGLRIAYSNQKLLCSKMVKNRRDKNREKI
jgi:beta-glucanase (GH16 family)